MYQGDATGSAGEAVWPTADSDPAPAVVTSAVAA